MPHMVNFEVLMQRNAIYREKECESLQQFEKQGGTAQTDASRVGCEKDKY